MNYFICSKDYFFVQVNQLLIEASCCSIKGPVCRETHLRNKGIFMLIFIGEIDIIYRHILVEVINTVIYGCKSCSSTGWAY